MAITAISRDWGVDPSIVRITTTDNLAAITTAGYLTAQDTNIQLLNNGEFEWTATDEVLIYYADGQGFFTRDATNATFIATPSSPGTLSDTLANTYIFVGNVSNVATGVAMSGATTISNTGVVSLAASIAQSAGQAYTASTSSATPGTIRALKGVITGSNTTMTSGNLVGCRGEVDCVGASGGFLYGAQGKVIATGTLSGSAWTAGVFGQLDISAATINAGQCAPIWGDYGATSGTLTNQTGLYGIAMTNTTAAVLAGQLYLYGGATNLMLLNTNAGLSGTTYFKAAGTSSGSAGYASGCNATEVLQISVNGTTYYLPCFAQNS